MGMSKYRVCMSILTWFCEGSRHGRVVCLQEHLLEEFPLLFLI